VPHTVLLPGGVRGANTVVRGGDGHVYPRGPFTGPYDPVYPSAPPSPKDVNSSTAKVGTLAYGTKVPIVYGLQQVEGRVLWRGNNVTTWSIFVGICAGPINAVTSCKINDATPSGVTITYFTGTATQAAIGLDSFYAGGTYRLPLLAYARIDYPFSEYEAYAAAEKFTFVVQGKLCSDPRENRITYSNDFRSTRGWSSATTFPTVSADGKSGTGGASDGWGGTSASEYTFSATPGTYEFYRDVALGLASGDPLTGTIRMRVASGSFTGTMEVKKGSSATTQSITVDTNWRTYRLTNTGSGTGTARLRIYGIPASTVLRVTRSSLQIKSDDYGYIETQASAVTPNTVSWTTNPVLQILDFATDGVYGAGIAAADINTANFGRGAADADHATETGSSGYYQAGIVINAETSARAVFETMRAYCGAQFYEDNGQLCIRVDVAQEDVLVAFDTTNAKDVTATTTDPIDKPTRVTVWFSDASNNYKQIPIQRDSQGLTAPATVGLRETKYNLPGITDAVHAARIANYYLKLAEADLRVTWTSPWVGVRLYKGALVTLTAGIGLTAQRLLIETVKRLPTGEYGIEAREYDSAVYASTSTTANTTPGTLFSDPYAAPGAPILGFSSSLQYLAIGPPRAAYAASLYGSSYWSTTNCTGVTASAINDGSNGATALTTAPTSSTVPANYAYVKLDLGAGASARFGKVDLTITAASSGAASSAVAGVWWQWSDDGSTWVDATSPTFTTKSVAGASATWTVTWEWPCRYAHRYWRMVQADTVGFAVLELQLYTFTENTAIHRYDITVGGSSSSTRTGQLPSIMFGDEPTTEAPLTLVAPGYSSYTLDLLGYGSQGSEGHVSVRAVTTAGVLGSWASSDKQFISSASGSDVVARVQTTSPGTAQSGNMNIDGAMLAGRFAANPNAAGSAPLLLQNVASPTVNQMTLLLGSTVYSALDKRGSLVTLESSRIAPWIEPMIVGTATTINSTTATDLNGLTTTFTPPSDCRAIVLAVLDAKMTATGSGFLGELVVNGSADSNQIIWNPQTNNERVPIIGAWTVALTGNTSYTIKMQGKLSGGAGTFSIAAGSRMLIVAVGRIP